MMSKRNADQAARGAKTEIIAFRLPADLRRRIEETAAAKDRTMSWLVEHYVKLGLNFEEDQVKEVR